MCPMGCCPTALQQPGRAKKKCTRAYGCYVRRTQALATNEVNRLNIGKSVCNAGPTTGHADQIEGGDQFQTWTKARYPVRGRWMPQAGS